MIYMKLFMSFVSMLICIIGAVVLAIAASKQKDSAMAIGQYVFAGWLMATCFIFIDYGMMILAK